MKQLDKAFNITPEVVKEEPKPVVREKPDRLTKNDVEKDYDYTRGNLYSIIEKGQEAIDGILELAQETEQPRAYEVAGQLRKRRPKQLMLLTMHYLLGLLLILLS